MMPLYEIYSKSVVLLSHTVKQFTKSTLTRTSRNQKGKVAQGVAQQGSKRRDLVPPTRLSATGRRVTQPLGGQRQIEVH